MSSSYYTAAQLEAMRKEQLRQDLLLRIAATKKQLESTFNQASSSAESYSNIEINIAQDDAITNGVKKTTASASAFLGENRNLSALDFSSILASIPLTNNPISTRLSALLSRIDERPILRREDQKEHTRLISGIHEMMLDKKMDIEGIVDLAEMRIHAYLTAGTTNSARDIRRFEELHLEYRALCSLLAETEKPLLLDELEISVPKMESVLLRREEDEYIINAIEQSMEAIGFRMRESCVLEKVEGSLYSVENSPLCDVFVAQDGGGFLFETVVQSGEESLNRRNQVEENARSICSRYNLLEEEAAKHGVILNCIDLVQPQYGEIASEEKITTSQGIRKRHQRQNREMHMEG